MKTFKKETAAILIQLRGSLWAPHPEVADVISEYEHFERAGKTPHQERRVSLQIFHASRAIDSLLAHVVTHEASKPLKQPAPPIMTLGSSQIYIRDHSIDGQQLAATADAELTDIRNDRNLYLHKANLFPADGTIQSFLDKTIRIISAVSNFNP
jgi:hypothetical protein